MNLNEVKERARELGVRSANRKKEDLVRAIQEAEGFFGCFNTGASGSCGQSGCAWRKECR